MLKIIKYEIIHVYKILSIKFGGFNCALKQACLNMQVVHVSLMHFDVITLIMTSINLRWPDDHKITPLIHVLIKKILNMVFLAIIYYYRVK